MALMFGWAAAAGPIKSSTKNIGTVGVTVIAETVNMMAGSWSRDCITGLTLLGKERT